MKVAKVLLASAVAGLMLAGSSLAVLGYEGQVPAQVTLQGTCRGDQVTATVLDSNGVGVSNVQVTFSFVQKGDAADDLSPASTMTDSSGQAAASLSLADVPGTRIIQATAGDSAAQGSLTLACKHGLPNTSADSPVSTDYSLPLMLLLAVAALGLGGTVVWRVARVRS